VIETEDVVEIRTSDGVGLAVEVTGAGPPLLLAHGHGGAKEDFADHVPALAAHHTVVTFDQRGHGASDKPDDLGAYTLDRLARDLLELADALGLGRVRVLGHSMGGMAVRRAVLQAPDRVEALVLMNTSPGPVPGFDPDVLELAVAIGLEEGKERLREVLDAFSPLDTPAYQRLLAGRPGYREFQDRKWADVSVTAWCALMRAIAHQADDLPALAGLRLPTLVLVGELDRPFLAASRAAAAAIPGARLAVVPDAGHSPQFENPAAWRAAVEAFLLELDAPAGANLAAAGNDA
jgi:3-oxoadipate enol-lactonase